MHGICGSAANGINGTYADCCKVQWCSIRFHITLPIIHRQEQGFTVSGRKNNCLYIHLVVKNTVDETVLKALEQKENIATKIVDD